MGDHGDHVTHLNGNGVTLEQVGEGAGLPSYGPEVFTEVPWKKHGLGACGDCATDLKDYWLLEQAIGMVQVGVLLGLPSLGKCCGSTSFSGCS